MTLIPPKQYSFFFLHRKSTLSQATNFKDLLKSLCPVIVSSCHFRKDKLGPLSGNSGYCQFLTPKLHPDLQNPFLLISLISDYVAQTHFTQFKIIYLCFIRNRTVFIDVYSGACASFLV